MYQNVAIFTTRARVFTIISMNYYHYVNTQFSLCYLFPLFHPLSMRLEEGTLRGCLHDTGVTFARSELTPVPFHGSIFFT